MKLCSEYSSQPSGDAVAPVEAGANRFSSEEMEYLHRAATLLELRRAKTLFSEGEEARFVYLIDDGIIRISRSAESGQRQILALRVPGDLFGIPESGRYANSAETVSTTKLYRISWLRLQQMMLSEPHLQFTLFTKMMRDFRRAQSRIVMLGQQNTCQRLVSFLLDLLTVPEFFDPKLSLLKLPINRFDLADFLGTAPETAARAFAKLESRGLVRRNTPRTIEILDLDGLRLMQRAPTRRRTEIQVAECVRRSGMGSTGGQCSVPP